MDKTLSSDEHRIGFASNWEAKSKGLQEQYPPLSDADLHYEDGKENELLCRLETRLNICREDVIHLLQKAPIVIS